MKKQLLLGTALLAAISAFPQNANKRAISPGKENMKSVFAQKYAAQSVEPTSSSTSNYGPQQAPSTNETAEKNAATSISWNLLCGSMNTYGMLVSNTKPLQYNSKLNAVSFIHRKSTSYQPSIPANSNSGNIVAEISSNWGATWDSTCIFADATNGARYPQGAIYNPPGNTNIANAHVVGCGPVTGAGATGGWLGNWYASKQLNIFDNAPSTAPGGVQFLSSSLATYTAGWGAHGFSRYGFSITDDGKAHSLACIMNDHNAFSGMRGVAVVKGSFNAGAFVWTTDSIIPSVVIDSLGDNTMLTDIQMAWNEAGTVGYVCIPGALQSSFRSNRNYQPIIYKTTNSGTSWVQMPSINFNSPAMKIVTDHLYATVDDTTMTSPFMLEYDMTVDMNNNLHIGAMFCSGYNNNDNVIGTIQVFTTTTNPTDRYKWRHVNNDRPYLYDFVGNGTSPWVVGLIDSIASEAPSAASGGSGYAENPWDNTGTNGAKLTVDQRIQLGHTPDGKYVTVSWAESDSSFIPNFKKWNVQPNINTRAIAVNSVSGAFTSFSSYANVSTNEINITKPLSTQGTQNPKVVNRATLHYMSPTCSNATVTNGAVCQTTVAEVLVPFTVTNSQPFAQLTNNTTYYSSARLAFNFVACTTGIEEFQSKNSVDGSIIYPNPAISNATVKIDLSSNEKVQVTVMNLVGQVVKTVNAKGQIGENNIQVDLSGLTSGVYMVNVKVGNSANTKKLIIE